MTYTVRITPEAEASIRDQSHYIAVDQQAPLNALRWLGRIYDAADTLDQWPRRCPLAEEDAFRPYEIRKLLIDGFALLFTILEDRQEVWITATRGKGMMPIGEQMPADAPPQEEEQGG